MSDFDDELLRRREEKLSRESRSFIEQLLEFLYLPETSWSRNRPANLVVANYTHLDQSLLDLEDIQARCGSLLVIHELSYPESEELNQYLPPGLLVPEGGARLFRPGLQLGRIH